MFNTANICKTPFIYCHSYTGNEWHACNSTLCQYLGL